VSAPYGLGRRLLFRLVGFLGKWLLALYCSTVRIVNDPESQKRLNREPSPRGVYAFWHSHQLVTLWHYRRTRAAVLVSRSRDGEYVARVAASLGYLPVRGSTSRGGAAGLKELVRLGREGRTVAITPDGPRGPRHSVSPGVLILAQRSGRPIVPLAVGLRRYWELPSWDRFRIPKPFSWGYACWGEPLHVPAEADKAALERLACELRSRLMALCELADRAAAHGRPLPKKDGASNHNPGEPSPASGLI